MLHSDITCRTVVVAWLMCVSTACGRVGFNPLFDASGGTIPDGGMARFDASGETIPDGGVARFDASVDADAVLDAAQRECLPTQVCESLDDYPAGSAHVSCVQGRPRIVTAGGHRNGYVELTSDSPDGGCVVELAVPTDAATSTVHLRFWMRVSSASWRSNANIVHFLDDIDQIAIQLGGSPLYYLGAYIAGGDRGADTDTLSAAPDVWTCVQVSVVVSSIGSVVGSLDGRQFARIDNVDTIFSGRGFTSILVGVVYGIGTIDIDEIVVGSAPVPCL